MSFIHEFAAESRQKQAAGLALLRIKDLPEVTGWNAAHDPAVLKAVEVHNKKAYDACVASLLADLA